MDAYIVWSTDGYDALRGLFTCGMDQNGLSYIKGVAVGKYLIEVALGCG